MTQKLESTYPGYLIAALAAYYLLLSRKRRMDLAAVIGGGVGGGAADAGVAGFRLPTPDEIAAAEAAEEHSLADSSAVAPDVELKMVCLVRADLNMSKGKIAAQVGHAVLGAYRVSLRLPLPGEWVRAWLFRAQAKIALKVDTEVEMDAIISAARAAGLPTCTIEDAGRTEVEPGTRTVTAIGPAPKALIDAITGPKGSHACRLLA